MATKKTVSPLVRVFIKLAEFESHATKEEFELIFGEAAESAWQNYLKLNSSMLKLYTQKLDLQQQRNLIAWLEQEFIPPQQVYLLSTCNSYQEWSSFRLRGVFDNPEQVTAAKKTLLKNEVINSIEQETYTQVFKFGEFEPDGGILR